MRSLLLALVLWSGAHAASAGTLAAAEVEALRADIIAMSEAFQAGDAQELIDRTHPSLHALAGGQEAYAQLTRQAVADLKAAGVTFFDLQVGTPTQTYPAGDEEVCFVPKTTTMVMPGGKARSTSFMIAIRQVGGGEWMFLEGAGLREHPELLPKLLPALADDVPLPPNEIELL